jgi:hypothetical protein
MSVLNVGVAASAFTTSNRGAITRVTSTDLRDVLDAALAGKPVDRPCPERRIVARISSLLPL